MPRSQIFTHLGPCAEAALGTGTGIVTVEGKGGGGEERPGCAWGVGRSLPEQTAACGLAGDVERPAGLKATLPTPGGETTRDIIAIVGSGL